MKTIPVAAIAVVVLWIGLSSFWMTASGAPQTVAATTEPQAGQQAPPSCAMMTSMPGTADGGTGTPPGSGMSAPQHSSLQGSDAGIAGGTTLPSATQAIMTEPVAPILALQDLYPTPPAAGDVITRLQAVEDRLAAALDRLEAKRGVDVASATALIVDNQAGIQPRASWISQLLSVIASGPVIGFALLLLLVLAATTRGRPVLQGATGWLQRSPTAQTAFDFARGPQFQAAFKLKQVQALTYLKSTGIDNPQGRAAQWARFAAQAERVQHGIVTRARPFLTDLGLVRQDASPGGSANALRVYGDVIRGTDANGKPLQAGVFEEGQVRAAAGLTLALGAMAFGYAYFAHIYAPIQIVTTLFFFEFLIRVTLGISYSPAGMIAHVMTRRQTPQLASAKPKRFAWTLGLVMSLAMMIITNSGIRGPLPMTICLICLTLMWLEAVLGLCLGCEIHRFLVRRGWAKRDEDYEICANGGCVVEART